MSAVFDGVSVQEFGLYVKRLYKADHFALINDAGVTPIPCARLGKGGEVLKNILECNMLQIVPCGCTDERFNDSVLWLNEEGAYEKTQNTLAEKLVGHLVHGGTLFGPIAVICRTWGEDDEDEEDEDEDEPTASGGEKVKPEGESSKSAVSKRKLLEE